jgi:hypothetical protein
VKAGTVKENASSSAEVLSAMSTATGASLTGVMSSVKVLEAESEPSLP